MSFNFDDGLPTKKWKKPKEVEVIKPEIRLTASKLVMLFNTTLKEKGKTNRVVLTKTNLNMFIQLNKTMGEEEVTRVVDWYVKNHNYKYCPEVYSIKGFKEKYMNFLSVMKRHTRDNPQIKVSKWAKQTAFYPFAVAPGNTDFSIQFIKRFPLALELTKINYEKFLQWTERVQRYKGFSYFLPDSTGFTIDWWMTNLEWARRKSKKLDPVRLAFRPDSNMTYNWIVKWADNCSSIFCDSDQFASDARKELTPQ